MGDISFLCIIFAFDVTGISGSQNSLAEHDIFVLSDETSLNGR